MKAIFYEYFNVNLSRNAEYAMYNVRATLVTGCLCFDVSGCICWGKHNFVGSWNDGEMSRAFQKKIYRDEFCLEGHGVVSDSAVPVSGKCFDRIMTL